MKQNYDKHVDRMENWKDIIKEEDQASKSWLVTLLLMGWEHSYDILGARMLWKPKEVRILKNFIEF